MKSPARFIPAIMVMFVVSMPTSAHPLRGLDFLRENQDELSITDEQFDEIEEIHYSARSDEIEKRAQLERAELEFQKIMEYDNPAEHDVMKAFERVATARMELEKISILRRLNVKQVLSDEQERELQRLMRDRKPRMHHEPRQRR